MADIIPTVREEALVDESEGGLVSGLGHECCGLGVPRLTLGGKEFSSRVRSGGLMVGTFEDLPMDVRNLKSSWESDQGL